MALSSHRAHTTFDFNFDDFSSYCCLSSFRAAGLISLRAHYADSEHGEIRFNRVWNLKLLDLVVSVWRSDTYE